MKVLVTVASKHGSTREIAEAIASELKSKSLTVDLQDAGDVTSVAGYDAVVFGSAIYGGSWLPDAKKFAEQYRAALADLPVWVFSSGPLGDEDPQPHHEPATLAVPMGNVRLRDHRIFVGKLFFKELGFGERLIARAVKAPEGDFRNWDEIRGWAREIAAELQSTNVTTA
jgi:menaquinone-dependent protoporphyrinogen oxidase